MIAKIAAIVSLFACVATKPVAVHQELAGRGYSFDNWGGFSSFAGFNNSYGSDNFVGSFSTSETTVTAGASELVCHSESVVIIQQRLLVLQEMATRVITEQICEVET